MSLNEKQSLVGNVSGKSQALGSVSGNDKVIGSLSVGRPLATIEVSEIEGGHKIKVTDPNGVQELVIMNGTDANVTEETIKTALGYKPVSPDDMVTAAKIGEVTLLASAWKGDANLYSQVVNLAGVTANSQVDLTPSVEQLVVFYEKDVTFVTENEGGTVTVYAIGQKPQNNYTIQVTITEVEYE